MNSLTILDFIIIYKFFPKRKSFQLLPIWPQPTMSRENTFFTCPKCPAKAHFRVVSGKSSRPCPLQLTPDKNYDNISLN
jgi:hypothetical protein